MKKKEKEPKTDQPKKKHLSRRERRRKADSVIRVEALERYMAEHPDEEIDPESIVSMYMPHRRARNFGEALLRMDKLRLILLLGLLAICILFIMSFMQEKMGNFTINLDRLELFRKGISISEDGEFTDPTARLTAESVEDATNIAIDDLPDDLDDFEGSHNGRNYMAYTYYVRNAGKEDVGYIARITLDSYSKGAEDAVRVAVWRNGDRIVYAEPSEDGEPETGCVNFVSHDEVCRYTEEDFLVGDVDKYTIVIWMEGDDPECVDAIVGGGVEFTMRIEADDDDDTSLLVKYIRDIKETLTGEGPINAAGTDTPEYYLNADITWENRRNQESNPVDENTDDTEETTADSEK